MSVNHCAWRLRLITSRWLIRTNLDCPIRKQAIPGFSELVIIPEDQVDPLHEDGDAPVPGLTHRYPDRVLTACDRSMFHVLPALHQKAFCWSDGSSGPCRSNVIDQAIEYIRQNPQIRDVLLSGGDPLVLSDEKLEAIIKKFGRSRMWRSSGSGHGHRWSCRSG